MLRNNDAKYNVELVREAIEPVYKDYPIVGQVALAQAILESRLQGVPSQLAQLYNNLFGIKGSGTAGTILLPTKEYIKGKWVIEKQGFARNKTLEDSIKQHRHLMETGTKSNPTRYLPIFKADTFKGAAQCLVDGGYATDPSYVTLLCRIKETYGI